MINSTTAACRGMALPEITETGLIGTMEPTVVGGVCIYVRFSHGPWMLNRLRASRLCSPWRSSWHQRRPSFASGLQTRNAEDEACRASRFPRSFAESYRAIPMTDASMAASLRHRTRAETCSSE